MPLAALLQVEKECYFFAILSQKIAHIQQDVDKSLIPPKAFLKFISGIVSIAI